MVKTILILALVQRDLRISKTRMLGNCLCIYFNKITILKGGLVNDLKTMLKSIHQISAFKVFFFFLNFGKISGFFTHFLQILLTEISSKMAMIFFYHQNSILYEFLKYRTTLKPRSRYVNACAIHPSLNMILAPTEQGGLASSFE